MPQRIADQQEEVEKVRAAAEASRQSREVRTKTENWQREINLLKESINKVKKKREAQSRAHRDTWPC